MLGQKARALKWLCLLALEGLAKARHPAPAKQSAAAQALQAPLLPALRNLSTREGEGAPTGEGASVLEGLAKARHPSPGAAAKAAGQAPAKQKESKKRSCNLHKPACALTKAGENASVRGGASILASLRSAPTKKQRAPEEPRALPLRAIPTYQRYCGAARAQSPARHGRLKPIAGFSSRLRHPHEGTLGSANRSQQLRPVPPC